MIELDVPGLGKLTLTELVCDYNGTLAVDGILLDEVRSRLAEVARLLRVHVITADTFGSAERELIGLPCHLQIVSDERQHEAKVQYIRGLGQRRVVALGNGRNDRLMLARAGLAIAVSGDEGIAVAALQKSHVVVRHPGQALDLLLKPKRLIATLRS